LPLRVEALPGDTTALTYYQLWHERTHRSAAARWLRKLVTTVARMLPDDAADIARAA
jgi:DNA-binding transcriptional LysR family regulator